MRDLNDLYYFTKVVEHGGFSAAARALNIPKSRLSRRIAGLEDELGIRLLQRSTRRVRLSLAGERFLQHCREMSSSARAALDAVQQMKSAPAGPVRISCPVPIAHQMLAPVLPEFLALWPDVSVEVVVTNRRVDLIAEGVDLALRVRTKLNTDADFVVRHIGPSRGCLVASPAFLARWGQPDSLADLADQPCLQFAEPSDEPRWVLVDDFGEEHDLRIRPALVCNDFTVLLEAATRGRGVTLLPTMATLDARRRGELVQVLPRLRSIDGLLHIIYPSRRGMMPAVRALLDFLADRLKSPDGPNR
ncbi:MAG: LysR family transcriptional regulator [Burkholderiaceae bacterium]|nr:LysR family transcriptional regulator [Burkholderiaceae bacterium]